MAAIQPDGRNGALPGFLDLLPPADRDELHGLGTRRRVPSGSVLFFEGDPAYDALVLLRGEVKITGASPNGHHVLLTVLGPGALVGELSPLDGLPRSASATALSPLELLTIPAPLFADFLERHPRALSHLLVSVSLKLRDATRRQLEWGTADALGRTCARLVELADRWGEPDGGSTVVASPVTQVELAAWSGLSREAVVKALRTLRRLGWVENRGRRFVIHDLDALRARSRGPDG